MKDMIKEILNSLNPAHYFNMGVQASKAQKVAYGHLQNHTHKMAIASSKELCEAANSLSECTFTEQKPHDHDIHKKPDVFGGQVSKNVKNAKIGPSPHDQIDSHNPKCAWKVHQLRLLNVLVQVKRHHM